MLDPRHVSRDRRYRQFCMVILFGVEFGSIEVFKPDDADVEA